MVKKKNWIKFIIVLLLSIIASVALVHFSIIDINNIRKLGSDFQYNMISMSSIIGGFLFTGISILISTIDKERINRLWENNYLDNLYQSAFAGMISNVITIIVSVVILCLSVSEKLIDTLIHIEITSLILGLVFFIWCIKKLISIILKLKSN